jgi:hypothetical protein
LARVPRQRRAIIQRNRSARLRGCAPAGSKKRTPSK